MSMRTADRSVTRTRLVRLPCLSLLLLAVQPWLIGVSAIAQSYDSWIRDNAARLIEVNQALWSEPELGLQEFAASERLMELLEENGFSIERGIAGMPTAFVATAGSGRPIIGILAEYDALPGMSQAPSAERTPRMRGELPDPNEAGHACGHSVFGTASTAAAISAWTAARAAGLDGTIRLYGTPAEETGLGKVYMARAGSFADLDVALHWHAGDRNRVSYFESKAVVSVKFHFHGLSAHASLSPHEGRSALDAVELMNVGVNYLREHLKDDARIHYVITDGGGQPNVIPAEAEVWYYLRADQHRDVEYILGRVRDIAEGAALMTGTELKERIDSDIFEMLPNLPLSQLLQEELARVGPPRFDESEREFAARTQLSLREAPADPLASEVEPLPPIPWRMPASTDVGNVSWAVPTGGLNVACYTLGAPGHSWQVVACTGMSIGEKGMLVAARTLAGTTLRLLREPEWLENARIDFDERSQERTRPHSLLPDEQRAPASIR